MTISDDELQAIRSREQHTTSGPWTTEAMDDSTEFGPYTNWAILVDGDKNKEVVQSLWLSDSSYGGTYGGVLVEADAEFIAHAREDIPKLLAENAQLQADLAAARGVMEAVRYECEQRVAATTGFIDYEESNRWAGQADTAIAIAAILPPVEDTEKEQTDA